MLLERIWLNTVESQDHDVAITARQVVSSSRKVVQVTQHYHVQSLPSQGSSHQMFQHSRHQQRSSTIPK